MIRKLPGGDGPDVADSSDSGKTASGGLAVGKSAVAGTGASKATYKVTGKGVAAFVVSKQKKSAKTVTIPATIKYQECQSTEEGKEDL